MLEEWAPCGTPAGYVLVVPGCSMLSSLATTTGILVLWAGKGAGLAHGDLEGGIPGNSLTRLNLGQSLGLAEGGESSEAFGDLCVGWKVGRAINLSILCRHSRILEPLCSRMSELDQTRCKQATVWPPGLEHLFKLAVVHLMSPLHLCSNPVR